MARALSVFGAHEVIDGDGQVHDWRAELAGRLVAMQSKLDGSWVNANAPRWWEGNPVLATAYALLTLGETL
jgi:squalene-hopene/tetraprenyl-beta-curcumene cyclase